MSGNAGRLEAIASIATSEPVSTVFDYASKPTSEVWCENVFSLAEMAERLPKSVYKSLKKTVETGGKLDLTSADAVAEAMKTWAIEKGATHYAHVFYPLTGFTAEKHDSFFDPDGMGSTISQFEGKTLIQGEPDGSSFPSGGIRATFEARGYTIWDVTSPAYIMENPNGATLCIPTAFVSWTGEALDKKTPVLRSMQALNEQAQRVLKFFGTDGAFVSSTAGAEQEYFLIDKSFVYQRPDLLACGRTLFGSPPPKGQEFDDHYFGAIPERVLACMFDVERECFKLGIPTKTRHNEVAPGQYEIAPVFEFGNVATDHQQLIMTTLKKVAEKYGMVCLTHEKPFAGVNGSGKHLNYSMGSANAGNLFDPGDTPDENAQFLVFCSAMIKSVYKWSKLLRAVVASASNDHRLGANEAPPAILSIFLGDELTEVMQAIAGGKPIKKQEKHNDRRRRRAAADSQTRGRPQPHQPDGVHGQPLRVPRRRFEPVARGAARRAQQRSWQNSLTKPPRCTREGRHEHAKETRRRGREVCEERCGPSARQVVFNGDGYSDAWHKEAEKRGLPNLKTAADALPEIKSEGGRSRCLRSTPC